MRDQVIKSLIDFENENSDYDDLINEMEKDKQNFIGRMLLETEPEEDGGRIAITGFYYQFLVTIEYLVEVMKGNWDFVALELHEDIIVGKGELVRFVQVKTSQETDQKASKTKIYRRSNHKVEDKEYRLPDSWTDKLFSKAKFFTKANGYCTQFELITSFVITASQDVNTSIYCSNTNFQFEIPDDDNLLNKLSEDFYDKNLESLSNYENSCGEDINSLLSRFRINKRIDLLQINDYADVVIQRINGLMPIGTSISREDFQWLIGVLMEKCQKMNKASVLFIDNNEAEKIKQNLHDRAIRTSGESYIRHNSSELIETAFKEILDEVDSDIKNIELKLELKQEINAYRIYLQTWLDNGGTIRGFMNKYLDSKQYSNKYFDMNKTEQNKRLVDLFICSLLLILINESLMKISDKHNSLLVKESKRELFSFMSLNRNENIEVAYARIQEILLDPELSLELILDPPSIVFLLGKFQGEEKSIQVATFSKDPVKVSGLPDNDSLSDMNIVLDFLSGGNITEQYNGFFSEASSISMFEMKQKLRGFWSDLKENKNGIL